jgi:hypothetical protein
MRSATLVRDTFVFQPCSSQSTLLLGLVAYSVVTALGALFAEKACYREIAKPFDRVAFWFCFFGWTRFSIDKNMLHLSGMTEDDFQTVVQFRRDYRQFSLFSLILISFVAFLLNNNCIDGL